MPRLDLNALTAAGADTVAKHEHGALIRSAYAKADQFNSNYKDDGGYTEAEAWEQAKRLDAVLEAAGQWLTQKPVKQQGGEISEEKAAKNASRWRALAAVCEQWSAELIDLGFRPLTGQWSGDPVAAPANHPNYWLERLDPKHRGAAALKLEYATWSTLPANSPHHGKNFFEFVDATRKDLLQSVRYDKGTEEAQAAARRIRRRESSVQVADHVLHRVADGGGVGGVFDTTGLKTEFAGTGFGIFVWDHKKRMYSGLHIANSLHHSTPRGGRPVLCAGEWAVSTAGLPLLITSKTGHYATTPKEFLTFLTFLNAAEVLTPAAICIPDTSSPTNGSWLAYAAKSWAEGSKVRKGKADIINMLMILNIVSQDLKCKNFLNKLADWP